MLKIDMYARWAIPITIFFFTFCVHKIYGLNGDHEYHANLSIKIFDLEQWPPHFLLHVVTNVVSKLISTDKENSLFLVLAISNTVCYWLFLVLWPAKDNKHLHRLFAALLLFTWPISLLFYDDRHLYLGYSASSAIHNPTIIFLKPFSILLFFFAVRTIATSTSKLNFAESISIVVLIILSALAKPNLVITLVPIVCIWLACVWLFRGRSLYIVKMALTWLIPTIFVLCLQYFMAYGGDNASVRVIFSPFEVYKNYTKLEYLLPKQFLSVCFPLAVFVLCICRKRVDNKLTIAGLIYVSGLLQSLLLAEEGPGGRLAAGNFFWSTQIGVFLFFFASLKTFHVLYAEKVITNRVAVSLAILLGMHVAFWFSYVYLELFVPGRWI